MSAVLLVKDGHGPRDPIRLVSPKLTLGRAPYADVGFESTYISRHHAEITREDDGFYIRDLGSSNGTAINGERLSSESRLLKAGDEIGLADGQVVLRFVESEDTVRLPPSTPDQADAAEKALVLDAQQRTVAVYGKAVRPNLSRKEFDVLALIYERAGQPVNRQDISVEGWPDSMGDVSEGEINQLIRCIRRKIEPDPRQPCFLLTDPGYGYRLDPYGPGSP